MIYILGIITGILLAILAVLIRVRTAEKTDEVLEKVYDYGKIHVMGEIIEDTDDEKTAFVNSFKKESDL